MKRIILTSILAITAHSATADGMQPNEENFSSAMADIYFKEVLDRGGDNSFVHMRQVSSVENQNIIRENRDTLYSWGLFDVTDGLTITLPAAGDLYMSALVIDNDTFIVREDDFDETGDIGTYQAYGDRERTIRISKDRAVTDFVYILLRTQTDQTAEGDAKAGKLQDQVRATNGDNPATWQMRDWDIDAVREMQATFVPYLEEIVAQGTEKGYNERGKTEPFIHNFYSAIGWGGQLERYATYGTTADMTEFGNDCAVVTINQPPVDYDRSGFWSYQVYGLDGYIASNNSTLNNQNTQPNDDATITLRFGSENACGTNENRADKNDDGFSITSRFYNRTEPIPADLLNLKLARQN
ncbi:DUF1254 domain-containing protein [Ruegeria sp. HKCCD7255]|uniref:DUF1254 domain-containing protein n=1 Tax=Ruegeria sp. HKCCD7255 TaxID=2683004 RepID=UPI001C2BCCDE|nr:DUF1254 domain-containing protein [Ruegeria sp. HKCCD7255]